MRSYRKGRIYPFVSVQTIDASSKILGGQESNPDHYYPGFFLAKGKVIHSLDVVQLRFVGEVCHPEKPTELVFNERFTQDPYIGVFHNSIDQGALSANPELELGQFELRPAGDISKRYDDAKVMLHALYTLGDLDRSQCGVASDTHSREALELVGNELTKTLIDIGYRIDIKRESTRSHYPSVWRNQVLGRRYEEYPPKYTINIGKYLPSKSKQ